MAITSFNGYNAGDRVVINTRSGETLNGTYSHHCPNGSAYVKADDGRAYERKYSSIRKLSGDNVFATSTPGSSIPKVVHTTSAQPVKQSSFSINQRFDFLQQLVRNVLKGTSVSLLITGEGGLGKSYTVKRELARRLLVKDMDYKIIKGYSTARGLYETLYENNGQILIFDDCDSILEDKIAINLLKGSLDSYDEREICWVAKSFSEDIPPSFIFTGYVIFISNMRQESIPQAILSRSVCVDVSMTTEDKLIRMEHIIKNSKDFMPTVSSSIKQEAIDLIRENLDSGIRELSLRTLEKVIKVRLGDEDDDFEYDDTEDMVKSDWKELAKYMLLN